MPILNVVPYNKPSSNWKEVFMSPEIIIIATFSTICFAILATIWRMAEEDVITDAEATFCLLIIAIVTTISSFIILSPSIKYFHLLKQLLSLKTIFFESSEIFLISGLCLMALTPTRKKWDFIFISFWFFGAGIISFFVGLAILANSFLLGLLLLVLNGAIAITAIRIKNETVVKILIKFNLLKKDVW